MTERSNPNAKPLSKEQVLYAAINLADLNGIESLSMRKLGDSLHVKAMSLYNHVKDKDDVLDGIVDIVVSKINVPTDKIDWKVVLYERAISAHEVLLLHPWASGLIMSRSNPGPSMLRYIDSTMGILRNAGFSIEMSDHAWNTLDSYIYGYTLQELNYPFDMAEIKKMAATYLPHLPIDEYPYMAELTQHIVKSSYKDDYKGVHNYNFGLDLILDGLERILKSQNKNKGSKNEYKK